jgi:hypothetical protein
MSSNATRRAALVWIGAFPAAAAIAGAAKASPPLASTVHWDRALDAYLEARDAYEDELKHGELRRAYNHHTALPGDAPEAEHRKIFEAEEAHHERFGIPRERALHALLLTAAPTFLALRQKVWIAQSEFIETVGDDDRPILSVIADDLTKLGGKVVANG